MDDKELRTVVSLLAVKLGGDVRFSLEEYMNAREAVARTTMYRFSGYPEFRLIVEEAPIAGDLVEIKELGE